MNKSLLISLSALALVTGACGKKTPPADIGPATTDPNAPAAVGSDESAWAQNRRAVTVVVR
jgi:hypothetical protein